MLLAQRLDLFFSKRKFRRFQVRTEKPLWEIRRKILQRMICRPRNDPDSNWFANGDGI